MKSPLTRILSADFILQIAICQYELERFCYRAVGRRWEYFFAASLNVPPAEVRIFQQPAPGKSGGASINEVSSKCCLRASLHFVQAVVPQAEKHPHRHPELRLSMLLCSGWRIQAHRCSCYGRTGFVPIARIVAGANGGVLFLWERLPERQRRPARGRQLLESTLKGAPPVLPGAI